MRVGIVSLAAGADDTGSAAALAAALADHGHSVVLLARRTAHRMPTELGSVRVRALRAGPPEPLEETDAVTHLEEFTRALRPHLDGRRLDVVHSHGWLAGLCTQLAARTGDGRPRPLPALVHTIDRLPPRPSPRTDEPAAGWARGRVERAVATNAGHLIATSDHLGGTLTRAGVPRDRVSVVPPGVSTQHGPRSDAGLVRGTRPYRVLIVGAATALDTSPATVARALRRLGGVGVVACGTARDPIGPDPAGGEDSLQLPHTLTTAERERLLNSADLVLSAEQVDTVHLDAMALGIPVFALNARVAEAVVDGVTGQHATGTPPQQLARTVRELLDNPSARQAMAIAAHDRVQKRYTWARIAGETARVYEHCIPTPPDGPVPDARPAPRAPIERLTGSTPPASLGTEPSYRSTTPHR